MSLHGFVWRKTHNFNKFFSRNIVTEDLQQNQMFQLRITAVAHISQKVATLSPPLWRLKREQGRDVNQIGRRSLAVSGREHPFILMTWKYEPMRGQGSVSQHGGGGACYKTFPACGANYPTPCSFSSVTIESGVRGTREFITFWQLSRRNNSHVLL